MADHTFMQHDVGQKIVRRLYEAIEVESVDTSTGQATATWTYQPIALVSGDTVNFYLKDFTNGSLGPQTGGGACTVNFATSEVTYILQAADVNTPRTWAAQHEITKATGEIITVPDEPDPVNGRSLPYLTVDILQDLG